MMKVLSGVIALALFVFALFPAEAEAGTAKNTLKLLLNKGVMTVGDDIAAEDITQFYYTYSSSTNPPKYQRYRFYAEDGAHWFYHEKREGRHWPLTEADITPFILPPDPVLVPHPTYSFPTPMQFAFSLFQLLPFRF